MGFSYRTGETDSWKAQQNFVHNRTQEKEAVTPQETHRHLQWRHGSTVYPYHSLASGQATGREHSSTHQQTIGVKSYWACPCPPEQDPVFPTASISYQEAFTSYYLHPSEDRQNENHNHRKLTELITWITTLCNSVKLWVMLCRATQDGRVIVERSDRTWSTGEGNGKPLQHSCLENPMNSMKRQKDRTLNDKLPRSVVPIMILEKTGETDSEEWRGWPKGETVPSFGCVWW